MFTGLRDFIGYHAKQIAIGTAVVGLGAVSYLGLSWLLGGKSKDDTSDSKIEELNENGLVPAENNHRLSESIAAKPSIENLELNFDASMTAVPVELAEKDKEQVTSDLTSQGKYDTQTEGLQIEHYNGKRSFGDPMPVGEEFLVSVNASASNAPDSSSVAVLASGGFIVVWEGTPEVCPCYDRIYGQLYNSTGTPQGSNFQVSTDTSHNQLSPSVASLIGGGFVVAWECLINGYIQGQLYNSIGAPQGSNFLVNTSLTAVNPVVAGLMDGGFVVAWCGYGQSSFEIYGQFYNSTGISQGNNFLMIGDAFGNPAYLYISGLIDGGFSMTRGVGWDGSWYSGIEVQLYDNAGVPQGSGFLVNTYTYNFQQRQSVASLINGDFVVTWGWNGGIYGQLYNSTGAPQGNNFQVSAYTSADQLAPSVAGLTNNGFVVTWYLQSRIYGQLYDSSRATRGNNFQVSTQSSSIHSSVASLTDGGFVVIWYQYAPIQGVYGRMFSNDIAPTVTTQPAQGTTTATATTTASSGTTTNNVPLIASVSTVGGVAVLTTALTVGICFWRKKHLQDEKRHRALSASDKDKENKMAVTTQELEEITKNSKVNVISKK